VALYVALLSGNKPDQARPLLAISDKRLVFNVVRTILEGVNREADEAPAEDDGPNRPTAPTAVGR
jgi:hypothetical protein